jgi:hypothetical protein
MTKEQVKEILDRVQTRPTELKEDVTTRTIGCRRCGGVAKIRQADIV